MATTQNQLYQTQAQQVFESSKALAQTTARDKCDSAA